MIASRDVVVSVVLDALLCVLGFELVLLKKLVEEFILDWHLLLAWEEAHVPVSVLDLEGPSVRSDVVDGISSLWVSV